MHGPQVGVDDLARVFALSEHGGILSRAGVVEVANSVTARGDLVPHGQVGNGVFVVVDSTHPGVERFLRQAFAHQGEHGAALFRPYHLTCVEVPMSIARAALDREATAAPRGFFTEVACSAKRDLSAGDELDGGGGSTVYAQVERAETARSEGLLPIGFADRVRLRRPLKKDQPVKWADVEVKDDGFLARLRRLQDSTIG
jgi:predicted homoserine dehydrogenase-like protein